MAGDCRAVGCGRDERKSGAGALKCDEGPLKLGTGPLKLGTGALKCGAGVLKLGAGADHTEDACGGVRKYAGAGGVASGATGGCMVLVTGMSAREAPGGAVTAPDGNGSGEPRTFHRPSVTGAGDGTALAALDGNTGDPVSLGPRLVTGAVGGLRSSPGPSRCRGGPSSPSPSWRR